jgi:hypothetical protein
VAVALLALTVIPASACRVPRFPPKAEEAAAAVYPRLGFIGHVVSTFEAPETKQTGRAVVEIKVTQDFSGKLPPTIYVLNPGCCVCVGITREHDREFVSIVRQQNDGLYHLDY